jgi:hypothetical protein
MKRTITKLNFALSFSALVMVDTDASEAWAIGLIVAWFVVSVFILRRAIIKGLLVIK